MDLLMPLAACIACGTLLAVPVIAKLREVRS